MTNFYTEEQARYVQYFGMNASDERWIVEDNAVSELHGIEHLFLELEPILRSRVNTAFDIGVGPAARELIRYNKMGICARGCDVAESVVNSARVELAKAGLSTDLVVRLDIRDVSIIEGGRFDMISCLNVMQHFQGTQDLKKLAKIFGASCKPGGLGLLLFKRYGFNEDTAKRHGLDFKEGSRPGEYLFFDRLFERWRPYQTYDVGSVISQFAQSGFRVASERVAELLFWNTRGMPCAVLLMEKQ